MCGRYALHANPAVVKLQFGLDHPPQLAPRYNIAPAADCLLVAGGKASLARWGLRGRFANLRAETVEQKFPGLARALVPASGFYEWRTEGRRKQPFYFFPADGALLALAALVEKGTFTLITTKPNAALDGIHDRMPVIIAREDYAAWLEGADGLMGPAPDDALKRHAVSTEVNRAAADSPSLIAPVELARGLFD